MLPLFTVPMYTMSSKLSDHTVSCCYCWLHPCRVSYCFLQGLGNIAQENIMADSLIEDQVWPLLDMVTVDKEREFHKPNSLTKHESFFMVWTVNRSCVLAILATSAAVFFLLNWFKKQNSRGCLWEHLQSSCKIMIRRPIIRCLCVRRNRERNKHTTNSCWWILRVFSLTIMGFLWFFRCWFTTLAMYSSRPWNSFGANIGWSHHLGI